MIPIEIWTKKFINKRHPFKKNVAQPDMKTTNKSCTNTIDRYFNRMPNQSQNMKSVATNDDEGQKVELVDVEKDSNVDADDPHKSIRIDEPKSEKSLKVENALKLLMMKRDGQGLTASKERKKRERKSNRF